MTNIQSLPDNLRRLRESRGLTQAEMGVIAGVSAKAVSTWELGLKTPRMGPLQKIADHFGITKSQIIEGQSSTAHGIRIPVFDGARLGPPRSSTCEILTWLDLSAEYSRRGELVGVKVHGDSMSPRILDGDICIVRLQQSADSGDVCIVFVGDDSTCKTVQLAKNGIKLIPYNSLFEPMYYTNQEIRAIPVVIYGKVIELRRSF